MTVKSDRHWYPRYPGDYARKTAHLSLVEHGAYALLMDWYYSNGKPLPDDWVQMHRICKAIAPDEQAAVQAIVEQFFVLSDAGWTNARADQEIVKKAQVSEKRRNAQAIREKIRLAKAGAIAPSNAHTSTTTSISIDNSKELSHPKPQKPPKPDLTLFNEFYVAYPHKVGREHALKAYNRAIQTPGVTHAILVHGAQRLAAAHAAAGTEKRYIPHPATWLNGGRWQDDLSGIAARRHTPPPAANARGSQFNAVMAAASELIQEAGGPIPDGSAGLSEWGLGTSLDVPDRPAAGPGLPRPVDRSDPSSGPTIDYGYDYPADG